MRQGIGPSCSLTKTGGIKEVTTVNNANTGGATIDVKNNLLLIYKDETIFLVT